MTTPPPSPRAGRAPPPRRRWVVLLGVGAAVLVVGGLVLLYELVLSDRALRLEYPVSWPVHAPRGDPVAIAYDVKPGQVFVTTVESNANFVLSVEEKIAATAGMHIRVKYTLGHVVSEAKEGGLRSTVKALLERADSDIPEVKTNLWSFFGSRESPYTVVFDRGEDRRPARATVRGDVKKPHVRTYFDRSLSGLGDLATNYLPARDVRLGETWELREVADLPGAQEVVHFISRSDATAGYPPVRVEAKVGAEALEDRDGEPTLRLRVVWYLRQEGEVVAPAKPGWITTAALLEGHVWVSRTTGIVWEANVNSRMKSAYRVPHYPTDRKGEGVLTWKTRRADKMPD